MIEVNYICGVSCPRTVTLKSEVKKVANTKLTLGDLHVFEISSLTSPCWIGMEDAEDAILLV